MTSPPHLSSTLNSTSENHVPLHKLSQDQQDAIIRHLVLPFGLEGKQEPAIHIHATAAGDHRVYTALSEALDPNGVLLQPLTQSIEQAMPALSGEPAIQSAKSYLINRQAEAQTLAEAFQPQSELVQTAVEYSARLIQGDMSPHDLPTGTQPDAGVLEDKINRLNEYAQTPLPVPRENNATHAIAFDLGHEPMHQALADACAPDGVLAPILAEELRTSLPDLDNNTALKTAQGYLHYWEGLAKFDVAQLPHVRDVALQHPQAGYETDEPSTKRPSSSIDTTGAQQQDTLQSATAIVER